MLRYGAKRGGRDGQSREVGRPGATGALVPSIRDLPSVMTITIYLGAVGRSGTTLLERTLATSDRIVALGEVVHLWDRGLRDDEPCACGQRFSACSFWVEVGRRGFGGWDCVDVDQLGRDRRMVDRNRYIPWLVCPRIAPRRFRESRERLLDVLEALYSAIAETSRAHFGDGVEILIDSSKHPSYLFLLRGVRGSDVRLLHIVRDPRGVAHSWNKHVARPESGEAMERLGTARACARWMSHNVLFTLVAASTPSRRLAYERFTADPDELGRALDDLAPEVHPVRLAVDDRTIHLGTDHTVSGNPMRFSSGDIDVRADERWRDQMPRLRRLVISVATGPLRVWLARK